MRDEKIMVGAFGEVQVMDWGFGKVLKAPEAADSPTLADSQGGAPIVGRISATVQSGRQ